MKLLSWIFGRTEETSRSGRQSNSEWDVAQPKRDEIERPANFVVFENYTDVRVAGLQHRENAPKFVRAARAAWRGGRGWPTITLMREADNSVDSTAIRILARLPNSQKDEFIGYIPADISALIAERYDPAMPLSGILRSVGSKPNGEGNFASIELLIPRKADRKPFERTHT